MQDFTNNAGSILTSGINNTDTSITLADASGFPTPAGGRYFYATLIGLNSNGQENAWEIVKYTAKASNTLTAVRAQEGTTAASWGVGIRLELRLTAGFATAVDAHMDNVSNPHSVTKTQVGLGSVDNTADSAKPVSTAQASADTAALNSAKSYADGLVVGLWDDRGSFNASVNTYPTTGGSGTAGAILKGDIWTVSVVATAGVLMGYAVGTNVRAVADTPGQTGTNWAVTEVGLGYVPENTANKRTSFQVTPDDTHYPTEKLVKDSLDAKVAGNAGIAGATKTKLTYDAKGLVTSGADATTADIADSANKRYVTDAQSTVLGNTSNINTGDETTATISAKSAYSPVRMNPREITANLTIPNGYNAVSAGPIVISDDVNVVVEDNANWSIV